jgi:hypothetical protein
VKDVTQKTTAKGDLYALVDTDGNEYTTFKRDIAESARSLKGAEAEVEFNETRNGTWLNLWLENVVPVRTEPTSGFTPVTQHAPDISPQREMRIMREAASKVAVEQLRYLLPAEQTIATLMTLTDWWVDYYLNGWESTQPPRVMTTTVPTRAQGFGTQTTTSRSRDVSKKADKQAEEYARVMGEAAPNRQRAIAANTCPICFGRDGFHSQPCPRRRRSEKP